MAKSKIKVKFVGKKGSRANIGGVRFLPDEVHEIFEEDWQDSFKKHFIFVNEDLKDGIKTELKTEEPRAIVKEETKRIGKKKIADKE